MSSDHRNVLNEMNDYLQFLRNAIVNRTDCAVDLCKIQSRRRILTYIEDDVEVDKTYSYIYSIKVEVSMIKLDVRCRKGFVMDFYIDNDSVRPAYNHYVYPCILLQEDWSQRMSLEEQDEVRAIINWWWDTYIPCILQPAERKRAAVQVFKEELAANVWHPRRVEKILEAGGFELLDSL